MREIYLRPGECATAVEPALLKTVLGSCVAVALFDAAAGVAGLNHFLLPSAPVGAPAEHRGRYGDTAIPWLVERMCAQGAEPARLCARLFGGGAVVQELTRGFRVGELNIAAARHALAAARIRVVEEDLGGGAGRHLTFNSADGTATVRRIASRA